MARQSRPQWTHHAPRFPQPKHSEVGRTAGLDKDRWHSCLREICDREQGFCAQIVRLQQYCPLRRGIDMRIDLFCRPLGTTWFKMLGATQNLTVPRHFWEPIRKSITQRLWGYSPEVSNSGRPVLPPQFTPSSDTLGMHHTLPVVTYISRQTTGRRLLDSDHQRLVAALRQLADEGICTVRIPVMEKLTLREQLAEVASSTILLGVHGNGLTHQLFMPPSLRSAVIEIQPPGGKREAQRSIFFVH